MWQLTLETRHRYRAEIESMILREPVLVGCGSSYFLARAIEEAFLEAGLSASPRVASEYRPDPKHPAVFFSRSGETSELLWALEAAQAAGVPTLAVTTEPGSTLARAASRVILLEHAAERSVVETRSFTSTLLLWRAILDDETGADHGLFALPGALRQAFAGEHPPGAGKHHFVFLGRGMELALAREASLKVLETCQLWSEAWSTFEYRHGPRSAADQDTLVAFLDRGGEGLQALESEIRALGATTWRPELDPLVRLALLHRMAYERALEAGKDPDAPQGLTRVVRLEGEG